MKPLLRLWLFTLGMTLIVGGIRYWSAYATHLDNLVGTFIIGGGAAYAYIGFTGGKHDRSSKTMD